MANALDYIDWRGDLSIQAVPVNEIDKYIFACIGKPDFTGIIPRDNSTTVSIKEASDAYFATHNDADDKLGLIASSKTLPLLRKAAEAERYADVKLSGFINKVIVEKTEQFSALTVQSPDGVNYISYRGTDDTIVAWKEDCELAVLDTVPAQRDALKYLEWAAKAYEGPLVVCGHSKGGNLAVYASCMASEAVQERIIEVYNYDGPGFMEPFFENEGYKRMEKKIRTVVPYKSIVGMLLNQAGALDVIQTEENVGIGGHDGCTWEVCRGRFGHCEELSDMSKIFRAAIAEALDNMDAAERGELVDEIFDVLTSTGAFMLSDFTEQSLRQSLELAKHFRKAPEVRGFIFNMIEKSLKQAKAVRAEQQQ